MKSDSSSASSLSGSLILADPSLREPTFFRTVLMLTDHAEQIGARGYILNRPLDQSVGDFLGSKEFAAVWEVPVFSGGPVGGNELMFISLKWDAARRRLHWSDPLGLEGAKAALLEGDQVRGFLGYAGWTAGQLEDEISRKSWITRPAARSILDKEAGEALWTKLLSSMGPFYKLLAATPADPGLN